MDAKTVAPAVTRRSKSRRSKGESRAEDVFAKILTIQRAIQSGMQAMDGSVGMSGQEAVGRILASGVQDMSSWVNKLYGQAFAAVYVQPGAKVAVHLEKPLAIDFDPEGRKVDHRAGESHALELE